MSKFLMYYLILEVRGPRDGKMFGYQVQAVISFSWIAEIITSDSHVQLCVVCI